MTRVWLLLLAIVEMVAGIFVLFVVTGLVFSHPTGVFMLAWPLVLTIGLFLLASAAIFLRRPWSYFLHMGLIVLIGVLYAFFLAPLLGVQRWGAPWVQAALLVVPVTVLFLLAPVRRYFGV